MTAEKRVMMQTPFGTAKWPALEKPEAFNPKEEPKYKITIALSQEDFAKFKADFIAKVNPKKGSKLPWAEKDGELIIRAASKRKPQVIDGRLQPILFDEGEGLGGGSIVSANVTVGSYIGGYNLYLNGVQVKKLVTKSNSFDPAAMFSKLEDDEIETADALDL